MVKLLWVVSRDVNLTRVDATRVLFSKCHWGEPNSGLVLIRWSIADVCFCVGAMQSTASCILYVFEGCYWLNETRHISGHVKKSEVTLLVGLHFLILLVMLKLPVSNQREGKPRGALVTKWRIYSITASSSPLPSLRFNLISTSLFRIWAHLCNYLCA